jgi:hypothetical protein
MVLRIGNRYSDPAKIRSHFRPQCIDWSERRNHLAGALGSAFADQLFERDWLKRIRESRAVQITDLGSRELKRLLGVTGN